MGRVCAPAATVPTRSCVEVRAYTEEEWAEHFSAMVDFADIGGKFDPTTEEITVYPIPDPAARDPHTAVFDADGISVCQYGDEYLAANMHPPVDARRARRRWSPASSRSGSPSGRCRRSASAPATR